MNRSALILVAGLLTTTLWNAIGPKIGYTNSEMVFSSMQITSMFLCVFLHRIVSKVNIRPAGAGLRPVNAQEFYRDPLLFVLGGLIFLDLALLWFWTLRLQVNIVTLATLSLVPNLAVLWMVDNAAHPGPSDLPKSEVDATELKEPEATTNKDL